MAMSPVLNPFTRRSPLAPICGNPYLSILHIWLQPCPPHGYTTLSGRVALTGSPFTRGGAGSVHCALGSSRWAILMRTCFEIEFAILLKYSYNVARYEIRDHPLPGSH